MTDIAYVLFPGRHHLLTRFQALWLHRLLDGRVTDAAGAPVTVADHVQLVWALTSANHSNTRRNPVPGHRREAAIERFSLTEGFSSLVVPVVDTAPTGRFADVTVKTVAAATGVELDPAATLVACSTPAVADMYAQLGYRIGEVEAGEDPVPARPWDVLEMLVAGDPAWRDLAHPASVDVFDRYGLAQKTTVVCTDPIVGTEGGLTETREYTTYAASFWDASDRKWEQIKDHVRPGRILDVGCATGGLLRRAGAEPRLHESDLIGVEVARHLFAEAEHLKAQGAFPNPNTHFYQRNVLAPDQVFPPRSIDTTITVALTHEIISYGDGVADLRRLAKAIFEHTAPGGVWVNSDVCGPTGGDQMVWLKLRQDNGHNPIKARADLDRLPGAQVHDYVASLSTHGRFVQFARDFAALSGVPLPYERIGGGTVELTLASAMEFMAKDAYHDNWLSEAHETFCALDEDGWRQLLIEAGFEVEPGSGAWRNDWLVEHRFDPIGSLTRAGSSDRLEWPDTHVLMVARRPEHA